MFTTVEGSPASSAGRHAASPANAEVEARPEIENERLDRAGAGSQDVVEAAGKEQKALKS
jgi:hypothetical protein